MDILRRTAEQIWEWIIELPLEVTSLFCRCAVILFAGIVLGQAVRAIAQEKQMQNTLPLQVLACFSAILLGLAVPLSKIEMMEPRLRGLLSLAAFCAYVLLPFAVVRFLVRRQGVQRIAWKVILVVEFLLLLIQLIVFI